MTTRCHADRVVQARQQTKANAQIEAMEAALANQQQEGAAKLSAANKASERALQVQVEEMDALRRLLHLMASRSDRAAETRAAKQVCLPAACCCRHDEQQQVVWPEPAASTYDCVCDLAQMASGRVLAGKDEVAIPSHVLAA